MSLSEFLLRYVVLPLLGGLLGGIALGLLLALPHR